MTCQELKNFIENSLPLERDSAAIAEARQHASTCPACAAALADMLRLEEALTRLPGVEADEQLTQAVMRRIGALASSSVRNRTYGDLLAVSLMVAGTLILGVVYWWAGAWGEELARFLSISIGGSWGALAAKAGALRIEILLPTLVGAALIAMGLAHDSPKTADAESIAR
jgi:hypothetical protein